MNLMYKHTIKENLGSTFKSALHLFSKRVIRHNMSLLLKHFNSKRRKITKYKLICCRVQMNVYVIKDLTWALLPNLFVVEVNNDILLGYIRAQ